MKLTIQLPHKQFYGSSFHHQLGRSAGIAVKILRKKVFKSIFLKINGLVFFSIKIFIKDKIKIAISQQVEFLLISGMKPHIFQAYPLLLILKDTHASKYQLY